MNTFVFFHEVIYILLSYFRKEESPIMSPVFIFKVQIFFINTTLTELYIISYNSLNEILKFTINELLINCSLHYIKQNKVLQSKVGICNEICCYHLCRIISGGRLRSQTHGYNRLLCHLCTHKISQSDRKLLKKKFNIEAFFK